jgi:hypothetical protein
VYEKAAGGYQRGCVKAAEPNSSRPFLILARIASVRLLLPVCRISG